MAEDWAEAFGWPRAARIHVDDVGFIERNLGTVAFDDFDVWICHEISFGVRSELGIIFYAGDAARRSDEMRQDGSIITSAGSDMDDVLAVGGRRMVNEPRMQRRLAIVKVSLRHNADENIVVQINGVCVGRRDVLQDAPVDEPWTSSEKVLPARCAECCFETRIVRDHRGGQNLLGIGRPDNAEFALPVHRPCLPKPDDAMVWDYNMKPRFGTRSSTAKTA